MVITPSKPYLSHTHIQVVEGEPEWVLEHYKKEKFKAAAKRKQDLEACLRKVREKELREKQRYESGESHHKKLACIENYHKIIRS